MTCYGNTYAQAQTPEGCVPGANPAQPMFFAGSACYVNASFFDTTGNPLIPSALQYRIDDLIEVNGINTGVQILDWTSITPAATVQILVTSAQNELISNSRNSETHQVLFEITDPAGNGPFYARCTFSLLRIPVGSD
jgi:hypothetical protein